VGILAFSVAASVCVQPGVWGSNGLQFSFTGSFAGSKKFRIWLAMIGVVLAAVVLVQAAFPIITF
jgi:hypothetical protein